MCCARDFDVAQRVRALPGDAFDLLADFSETLLFRVRPGVRFAEFKETVLAKHVGVPAERQRWWIFKNRINGTKRPSVPVDESLTVGEVLYNFNGAGFGWHSDRSLALCLFLETPPLPISPLAPPPSLPRISEDDCLLFFKARRGVRHYPTACVLALGSAKRLTHTAACHAPRPPQLYDPYAQSLVYLGHAFAGMSSTVQALHHQLLDLLSLPRRSKLLLFEEIRSEPVMVQLLESSSTLKVRLLCAISHNQPSGLLLTRNNIRRSTPNLDTATLSLFSAPCPAPRLHPCRFPQQSGSWSTWAASSSSWCLFRPRTPSKPGMPRRKPRRWNVARLASTQKSRCRFLGIHTTGSPPRRRRSWD